MNVRLCRALFNESLVKVSYNHSLVYEPLDDSLYSVTPVLATIQIFSDDATNTAVRTPNSQMISSTFTPRDGVKRWHNGNDGRAYNYPAHTDINVLRPTKKYGVAREIVAYQVEDMLWVVDPAAKKLLIYDEHGEFDSFHQINELSNKMNLFQDNVTRHLYCIENDENNQVVQRINENGMLSDRFEISKQLSNGALKISNGYLYFRNTSENGDSIKRVLMN